MKSTVSRIFEDLKFKISEGLDSNTPETVAFNIPWYQTFDTPWYIHPSFACGIVPIQMLDNEINSMYHVLGYPPFPLQNSTSATNSNVRQEDKYHVLLLFRIEIDTYF